MRISSFEDLEEAHHALGAGGGEPVDIEPAAGDRIGAQDQRLDHVGAAADAAIDDDVRAPANRFDDFRQHVDRTDALIELAPTMVRHIDAVDAVLDRNPGVLDGGDALEDQRDVEALLDPLDVTPVELRLKDAGVGDARAAALMALGNVALAQAVAVRVDGPGRFGSLVEPWLGNRREDDTGAEDACRLGSASKHIVTSARSRG